MKKILVALLLLNPLILVADGEDNSLLSAMDTAEKTIIDKIKSKRQEVKEEVPKENTYNPNKELLKLYKEVEALKTKVVYTKQNTLATKNPRKTKKLEGITYYSYKPGSIYELHTSVDRVSDISLEVGEHLTSTPVAGDTVRWKIGSTESGEGSNRKAHIIVKPLEEGIETNILLTTNKRTYHIRALSSNWYMPEIAWNYPENDLKALKLKKRFESQNETIGINPEKLSFDYKIKGDEVSWRPLRVFNDGRKTYLHMSKELEAREAPVLFILNNGKEPRLTNYRIKGDYYIVDELFRRATLRVGKDSSVTIYSKDYKESLFERIF